MRSAAVNFIARGVDREADVAVGIDGSVGVVVVLLNGQRRELVLRHCIDAGAGSGQSAELIAALVADDDVQRAVVGLQSGSAVSDERRIRYAPDVYVAKALRVVAGRRAVEVRNVLDHWQFKSERNSCVLAAADRGVIDLWSVRDRRDGDIERVVRQPCERRAALAAEPVGELRDRAAVICGRHKFINAVRLDRQSADGCFRAVGVICDGNDVCRMRVAGDVRRLIGYRRRMRAAV